MSSGREFDQTCEVWGKMDSVPLWHNNLMFHGEMRKMAAMPCPRLFIVKSSDCTAQVWSWSDQFSWRNSSKYVTSKSPKMTTKFKMADFSWLQETFLYIWRWYKGLPNFSHVVETKQLVFDCRGHCQANLTHPSASPISDRNYCHFWWVHQVLQRFEDPLTLQNASKA